MAIKIILIFCLLSHIAPAQFRPGFDKREYRELILVSARSTADSSYYNKIPKPERFTMIYQSRSIGLDNMWDLWLDKQNDAVISIRGTTAKPESWLANVYAAMTPARGEIKINKSESFEYHLADNPKAAVHTGWLLSLAYLSKEILPKIDSLYNTGVRNFFIMGHSQGGAIAYLLTAHLYNLRKNHRLHSDIRIKTYCSAAPKPGNLYFAYDYETMTYGGWAFNVVNAADWVPEVPISVQTLNDFNSLNPFANAKSAIRKQKFPKNLVIKHIYNQMDKPLRKSQKRFQKYLGKMTSKMVKKYIPDFSPPPYYPSSDYVRTGTTIVLHPDEAYFKAYPENDRTRIFLHHYFEPYLFLLDHLPDTPSQ